MTMTTYFFSWSDEGRLPAEEGVDFPSLEEACRAARLALAEGLLDSGGLDVAVSTCVFIHDADGNELCRVSLELSTSAHFPPHHAAA